MTSDFSPLPSGFWIKNSDGTGPYVQTAPGTFSIAATGTGGGGGGGGAVTVADGADVAEGATADAVVAAGAAGTVSAKLRRVTSDLGTLKGAVGAQATAAALAVSPATDTAAFRTTSVGRKVRTAVTRPANQTPYTGNDVVGGAIDLGVLGPATGHVMITSIDLIHEVTALPAGMTSFRLYLYDATPPSAAADNAAFDLAAGDLANFIGYVDFGVINDLGSNLFVEADNVNKHVVCGAAGHLFAYLVTTGGWTPGANSTVFDITIRTMEV